MRCSKKVEEGSRSFDELGQCIIEKATSHRGRLTIPHFKQNIKDRYKTKDLSDEIFARFMKDLRKHREDLLQCEKPPIRFASRPQREEIAEINARHAKKRQEI